MLKRLFTVPRILDLLWFNYQRIIIPVIMLFLLTGNHISGQTARNGSSAEQEIPSADSSATPEKTGWSFGAVPALGYNADKGFQYGIVLELYNFGDGSTFPNYMHTLRTEWSRYTGGSGINKAFFDAPDWLFGSVRVTSFLGYLTERLQPFYGFNGYASTYNPAYITSDESESDYNEALYKSRIYYTYDRELLQFTTDFQGDLSGDVLRWIGGVGSFRFSIGSTDIEEYNNRHDNDEPVPDSTLYTKMVHNGEISSSEATGGLVNFLKAGLIYDSRDQEANPMSGLWSELLLTTFPEWLGSDYQFTLLTVMHRQYFTLFPEDLSFAYRLGYQHNIAGNQPFFMEPFLMSSWQVHEGLGGQRTIRGVLQNRAVGESMGFGNFELRWKPYRTRVFGQQFYLGLNLFLDTGRVLSSDEDALHTSYGFGLRLALNQNFILGADYGIPLDERDGPARLYTILGYLF